MSSGSTTTARRRVSGVDETGTEPGSTLSESSSSPPETSPPETSTPARLNGCQPGGTASETEHPSSVTRLPGNRSIALLVSLVSALMYWPSAFGIWHRYDDEGAMLLVYRSFAERGGLYKTTYNNYGPFPFTFWWVLLRPFGFAYSSLFVGRAIALGLMALSAGLTVLIVSRFAGRWCAAVVGFVVADLLTVNFNEPFHPGALIGIMLLTVVYTQTSVLRERERQIINGFVCSALVLTKVNLGIFVLLAWLAATVFTNVDSSKRLIRRSVAAVTIAFPVILVLSGSREWQTVFMAIATSVALAVTAYAWFSHSVAAPTNCRAMFRNLAWFGGAGIVMLTFSLSGVLSRGSSVSDVYSGMVSRALRQRGVFSLLVFSDRLRVGLLVVASGLTLLCISRARQFSAGKPQRWELVLIVFVELICGGEILVTPSYGLSLLPVVALLVGPRITTKGEPSKPPSRLIFPVLLGLLQVLHAYPVAGSQMGWAMLVITVLGGLVFAQGATDAKVLAKELAIEPKLVSMASLLVAGVAAISIFGFAQASQARWAQYRTDVPLDRKHAKYVRLDKTTVSTLQTVAKSLKTHCSSYYALPGLGTFSAMTQLPMPTGFNATVWPLLFSDVDQRTVIADLKKVQRLCFIRNDKVLAGWMQGRPVPRGPLLDYLAGFDRVVAEVDGYNVYTTGSRSE